MSPGPIRERPRVLHWFRADLRLTDNTAFSAAATRASRLGAVFIFDDTLVAGPRSGVPRTAFLHACVSQLAHDLARQGQRLLIRRGRPEEILPALASQLGAQVVTWNREPSGYAKRRDARVTEALEAIGIAPHAFRDRVVFDASEVAPRQDRPIAVFSPYRKAWWRRFERHPPAAPRVFDLPPPFEDTDAGALPSVDALCSARCPFPLPVAGESGAQTLFARFLEEAAARYKDERDFPAAEATSNLSPHLRFGTISIRECIRRAQTEIRQSPHKRRGLDKWIDELIWREFYQAVLDAEPSLTRRNHRREYDAFEWEEDPEGFACWAEGRTGYPFVDAGLRSLRATGTMHNRLRMVVASFLVRDLLIDWRRGERFFMQWLVDGDPAANSGGWQWAAGTGTDAAPEPRIFNPVLQGQRFDPEGDFVRRWIPELRALPGGAVHRPWEAPLAAPDYPAPIVDHAFARERALERIARLSAAATPPTQHGAR